MSSDHSSPELIEQIAEHVYEGMTWGAKHREAGDPPKWLPGGNSDAQYEARAIARKIASIEASGTDGVVAAGTALLEAAERHIFGDECKAEREAFRAALARFQP